MTRVDGDYTAEDVRELADRVGVPVTYRRSRCQHGYTRDETCVECENGYVDDCHNFALLPNVARDYEGDIPFYSPNHVYHGTEAENRPLLCGATDDLEWIAYIPGRFRTKLDRYYKEHGTLWPEGRDK